MHPRCARTSAAAAPGSCSTCCSTQRTRWRRRARRGPGWALKVHMREERVHLVLEDNGPGIPPGPCSRLFTPFFTTKAPGKGTGLGHRSRARSFRPTGLAARENAQSGRGALHRGVAAGLTTLLGGRCRCGVEALESAPIHRSGGPVHAVISAHAGVSLRCCWECSGRGAATGRSTTTPSSPRAPRPRSRTSSLAPRCSCTWW